MPKQAHHCEFPLGEWFDEESLGLLQACLGLHSGRAVCGAGGERSEQPTNVVRCDSTLRSLPEQSCHIRTEINERACEAARLGQQQGAYKMFARLSYLPQPIVR